MNVLQARKIHFEKPILSQRMVNQTKCFPSVEIYISSMLIAELLSANGFFNVVLLQIPEDVPGSGAGGSGREEAASRPPPTASAGRPERAQASRHGTLHERSPETYSWCM